MSNPQPESRFVPHLDDMLTREQAAAWLHMTVRDLAAKSAGLKPKIPVFKLGHKTVLYHPRTVIAKMANDAGVPAHLIAASFGMHVDKLQP